MIKLPQFRRWNDDHLAARQAADLIVSTELEETGPPIQPTVLIGALCGVIVTALAWSALTRIDEVVRAPGQTEPRGEVAVVRHLTGGVIDRVLVREGQSVTAGDVVAVLSTVAVDAELARLSARGDQARLALARAEALTGAETPVDLGEAGGQANAQARLRAAQTERRLAQLDAQRALVARAQAALDTILAQIPEAEDAAVDLAEEEGAIAALVDTGAATRDRLRDARREARAAATRVDVLKAERALQDRELRSAEARLAEIAATQITDTLTETTNLLAELAEINALIAEAEDRRQRLTVRAPTDGVVAALAVLRAGDVVTVGQELMQIVPMDSGLVIHASVSPRDISRVTAGGAAAIRVEAYDHMRYGEIFGVIDQISATTALTDTGEPFYKVTITPERGHFGEADLGLQLLPGMTVQAHIKNGERSLLSYLTRPISRGWAQAFREG